jgi:hypothetical protein
VSHSVGPSIIIGTSYKESKTVSKLWI